MTTQPDGFDLDAFLAEARSVYQLLNQTEHWIDAYGQVRRLEEMSIRYKSNVLAFMRARCRWFAARYVWGDISQMSMPSGWHEVVGDGQSGRRVTLGEFIGLGDCGNMDDAYDRYLDWLLEQTKRSPEDWLDSTPLMRALSDQVISGEGGDVGDRDQDAPVRVGRRAIDPVCGQRYTDARHRRSQATPTLIRACDGKWVKL